MKDTIQQYILPGLIIVAIAIALIVVRSMSQQKVSESRQKISETRSEKVATSIKTVECSGRAIAELTEGPYYTADSPEVTNLYTENIPGTKIVLSGYVLDTDCKPLSNVWIDFWQADGEGNYDNSGYTLRGHQYTDSEGKYTLTTVIPGEYPGRTPHIHVKLRATQDSPVITSQLFLPDVAQNQTDSIFDESLIIALTNEANGKIGSYNFVVNTQ
jgi:protocatechuate 3,4-dioxygenase beta subunit